MLTHILTSISMYSIAPGMGGDRHKSGETVWVPENIGYLPP